MRKTANNIALVNRENGQSWLFQFFPTSIGTDDKANFKMPDASIGTKPLFYSNREPQIIKIDEVWLDGSDDNESTKADLEGLRSLVKQSEAGKPPPRLLFICGDWQERVVMESLSIQRERFSRDGQPMRAKVSMTLIEIAQNEQQSIKFIE